jgi:hypothetical protein
MTQPDITSPLDPASAESLLEDLTICQVCFTETPTWRIPLVTDVEEGRTPWLVCTSCLSVVEENDPSLLAQRTLDGLNNSRRIPVPASKAARKKQQLSSYITFRKIATQLLREINGDPVAWKPE